MGLNFMLKKLKEIVKDNPFLKELSEVSDFNNFDILNVYMYGSRVYGTHSEKSDYDYIMVTSSIITDGVTQFFKNNVNVTIYNQHEFAKLIIEHEISILECLFLPSDMKYETIDFEFKLDRNKLRESISAKASNSWVKAKKKMTVEKDLDMYVGQKSLFHSMRILNFGIQLAESGKIKYYDSGIWMWGAITATHKNPLTGTTLLETWEDYNTVWKRVYNLLKSDFKKVCPKV